MLLAMRTSDTEDDEKWEMRYPQDLIGWLVNHLGQDFQWTPTQILDVDHHYPALVHDIDLEIWQRRLMRKEFEARNKKDD